MIIRWSPQASADLEEIHDYIALDDPFAAVTTVRSILRRIELLRTFPKLGRPGITPATRQLLTFPLPYKIDYRAQDTGIEIIDIWHGAQDK